MNGSARQISRGKKDTLWKNFIYSGYSRSTTNSLVLRQLFFINTFSMLGFLAVTIFGIIHVLSGSYHVGIPELTGGFAFLCNLILLRVSKHISLVKGIVLATQGTLLLVQLATGGFAHTGIYWYFTFPVAAFFLMGKKNGIIWMCLLYVATLLVLDLALFDKVLIVYTFVEIRQLLISLFFTTFLIYLYQNAIEETETVLEKEKVKDDALLESIGEGILAVEKDGTISLSNKVAVELLGLQIDHLIGNKFTTVYSLLDTKGNRIPEGMRPINQALLTKEKIIGEYVVSKIDNTTFTAFIAASPVVLEGKIIGAIQLFRDITHEKELEKAKSEFVALASHQLRTPISAIAWFTEMILHGDVGTISAEQREHLTLIYQSNQRMATLVDALLTVSEIEMGNFTIKPEPTDLGALCHKVINEEKERRKLTKIPEIKEIYDQALVKISVDPNIMKIILQNLISNAVRYTSEKGTITATILPSGQGGFDGVISYKDGVLITIADTGYGIPKAQEEKIFTKLFRATNIKERDTDGTGLGLYIVRSIVDEVGGKIWFKSKENKGTTFFVWLPKIGMKEVKGDKSLLPAGEREQLSQV